MFELAGGEHADVVVIGAAHERAALYGQFAVRALSRYGPFVELLPLAVSPQDFGVSYPERVADPALLEQVRQAKVVFFVGGAPQRLAEVLFGDDGQPTPLAKAVAGVFDAGGVIVGGIPAAAVAATGVDAMALLDRGELLPPQRVAGLGLLDPRWYVDQHFFSPGRFAETIVAMNRLGTPYGIGVGPDTAVVVRDGELEVFGGAGAMIVDLSVASPPAGVGAFEQRGVRLSYLEHGDRMRLDSLELVPAASKRAGFAIAPGDRTRAASGSEDVAAADALAARDLARSLHGALDGHGEVIRYALPEPPNEGRVGFRFRFYSGADTSGWQVADSGNPRFTARNVYLDVTALSAADAASLAGRIREESGIK